MPDFGQGTTMGGSNDTVLTVSGTIAAPIQNGPVINNDKVRYVWMIRGRNNAGVAADLIIFAGDVGNVLNRIIYRATIPALGTILFPPLNQRADMPLLRVAPLIIPVFPFVLENMIKIADPVGGQLRDLSLSQFDRRG
jgi:hypothetical protein